MILKRPRCPVCEKNDKVEECGESGEFWFFCHRCEKDFDQN